MKIKYYISISLILIINYVAAQDTATYRTDCTIINNSVKIYIENILIEGNLKTKKIIIINEIDIKKGDKLSCSDLKKRIESSKENLLRTPLFNTVNIEAEHNDKKVTISIKVTEKWYLWPEVMITYADQNFSNWLKNKEYLRSDMGIGLKKYNFRGRNEKIYAFAMTGYDNAFFIDYSKIKLDKTGKHSISSYFRFTKRNETQYSIVNDKVQYFSTDAGFAMKEYKALLTYSYRPKPNIAHQTLIGYHTRTVNDSILHKNIDYFGEENTASQYFFLRYIFSFNSTNSRIFPTGGKKLSISIQKTGFGFFPDKSPKSAYVSIKYYHYIKLSKIFSSRNHISTKSTFGKRTPFFTSGALGYSNSLSGYEFYTVHGKKYIFMQQRVAALLLKNEINLSFLPLKQFNKIPISIYFEVYGGYGYVQNNSNLYIQNNRLANQNLLSLGTGINFVTYYDKLLRVEYSINHLKEHGFFLHFESAF